MVPAGSYFQPQVNDEIKVVLRQVRVHVIDESGQPVKGLARDRFVVTEDNQERELSTFEETDLSVRSLEPTSLRPSQSIRSSVIMFDSSNLDPQVFKNMREAVKAFVVREFDEHDLVKIVQMERSLIHLTPFTGDTDRMMQALAESRHMGFLRHRLRSAQSDIESALSQLKGGISNDRRGAGKLVNESRVDDVLRAVDAKEREKMLHARSILGSLSVLSHALSQVPGSRSIFLFSGGTYLQDASGSFARTQPMYEDLAREMNAKNITLYSFLHTPKLFTNHTGNPQILLQRYASPAQWTRIARLFNAVGSRNTFFENELQIESGPRLTADWTGGMFRRVTTRNRLGPDMTQFAEATHHYYTLGYVLEPNRGSSKLRIELKQEHADWRLIYGKSLSDPKPFDEWSKDERQLSFEVSMLYADSTRNDLDADFAFRLFCNGEKRFVIPAFIAIPATPIPKHGYEVGMMLADDDQSPQDITQTTVHPTHEGTSLIFYNVLMSPEPPAVVKCFIRNLDNGKTSLLSKPVTYRREQFTASFRVSPIILAARTDSQVVPINHLEAETERRNDRGWWARFMSDEPLADHESRRAADPLTIHDRLIVPPLNNRVPASAVDILFHVIGLDGNPQAYELRFRVDGKASGFVDAMVTAVEQDDQGRLRYAGRLDLSGIPDGDYTLSLQILNADTGRAAVRTQPITIGAP